MKQILKRARAVVCASCLLGAGLCGAAPVITGIAPAAAPSGASVALSGAGFSDTVRVLFDTVPADFTVAGDRSMVVIVPREALSGSVTVRGASGVSILPNAFRAAPRIEEILPARSATNAVINLYGVNMTSVTHVLLGAARAAFSVLSAQQLATTVPFGASNAPITLESVAGPVMTEADFVVTGPEPLIDGFSPLAAPPGATIEIRGANFQNITGVLVGNIGLQAVSAVAPTLIRATIPAGAGQITAPITVRSLRGTNNSAAAFTITRVPFILDFDPKIGTGGSEVLIRGLNLSGITAVTFNGVPALGFGTPEPERVSALVPPSATTGPLRVANAFGAGEGAVSFVVTRAPLVRSFDQEFIRPGQTLVVRGANFTGTTRVRINTAEAAFVVAAATQLNVTVPANAASGPVTVFNAFGTNATSPTILVTGNAPFVTGVEPPFGPRGAEVLISGAGFLGTTAVRFNGVNAAFSAVGENQIRATVPPGAATGRLTVTSGGGTSTNAMMFHVPPRLTSFTPTNGVVGTDVTIEGASFPDAFELSIGGRPVPFAITASNRITATIAPDTRSGTLTVRAPGGDFRGTARFTVLPALSSFEPSLGSPGATVTLRGTSFFDVQGVTFNGVQAASFTVVSPEEIRVVVPASAVSGLIRVTTSDGAAASSGEFVVTGPSDLVILQTVSTNLVQPGGEVTYFWTAWNSGRAAQSGVFVAWPLPAGAQFVSGSAERGTLTNEAGILRCVLGVMPPGERVNVTARVRYPAEGVFNPAVTITGNEPDLAPANNSASFRVVAVNRSNHRLWIEAGSGGSGPRIRWPGSALPFVLEATPRLTPPVTWTNVVAGAAGPGGTNQWIPAQVGSAFYYRLRLE